MSTFVILTHHGVDLVAPGASVGDHSAGSVAPIIGHGGPSGGGGDSSAAFCKESNHDPLKVFPKMLTSSTGDCEAVILLKISGVL